MTIRWPWIVAVVAVALIPLLPFSMSESPGPTFVEVVAMLIFTLAIGSLAVVGASLTTRVPKNPIGYLLLTAASLISISTIADLYASAGTTAGDGLWPLVVFANLLGQTLFIYGIVITLIVVPLVFPTGQFLGPRWKWVLWLVIASMAALTISVASGSELPADAGNSLATASATDSSTSWFQVLLEAVNAVGAFIGAGAAVFATLIRLRRSHGIERQQMKWFTAVAAVAALTLPLALVVPSPWVSDALLLVALTAFAFLPIAIGIAVLRYRLYEIDRIISRTIGWAIVTGLLVGTLALLVLGSSAVLEPLTGGNTLAVAGSTLIVAALFAPLRGRVQRAVDRRFDRSRYDGEQLIAAFGERLRDEVDLETIRADVLATVDAAVRPAGVGLWLRGRPGDET